MVSSNVSSRSREKVLGGLRIGRILITGLGGNLGYLFECCLREFSKDTLSGGSGNDVIDVWHKPAAVQDVVACGSGFDRVIADRATLVAPDCEKVVVVHGSKENSFEQSDAFYESIPQSFFEGLPPPP